MVEEKTSSLAGLTEKEVYSKSNKEIISTDLIDHLIDEWITISNQKIPRIKPQKTWKDLLGTLQVRLGFNRMSYKIPTGLYAIGHPKDTSKVIVSANYKLTFDVIRQALVGENVWLLILDTKGINVWCAAGKGTFGSKELIYQIEKCQLKKLVNHRNLILPQLGATSMEPHLIKKYTGFDITYGPIRAADLKPFLKSRQVTEKMRQVNFNIMDRLILTPIELIHNLSFLIGFLVIATLLNVIVSINLFYLVPGLTLAIIISSVIFPIALPYLPFKSFSMKSIPLIIPYLYLLNQTSLYPMNQSIYYKGSHFILLSLLIMYQSFNFTGSTTFTSFSGVKKESQYLTILSVSALLIAMILIILGGVL